MILVKDYIKLLLELDQEALTVTINDDCLNPQPAYEPEILTCHFDETENELVYHFASEISCPGCRSQLPLIKTVELS